MAGVSWYSGVTVPVSGWECHGGSVMVGVSWWSVMVECHGVGVSQCPCHVCHVCVMCVLRSDIIPQRSMSGKWGETQRDLSPQRHSIVATVL